MTLELDLFWNPSCVPRGAHHVSHSTRSSTANRKPSISEAHSHSVQRSQEEGAFNMGTGTHKLFRQRQASSNSRYTRDADEPAHRAEAPRMHGPRGRTLRTETDASYQPRERPAKVKLSIARLLLSYTQLEWSGWVFGSFEKKKEKRRNRLTVCFCAWVGASACLPLSTSLCPPLCLLVCLSLYLPLRLALYLCRRLNETENDLCTFIFDRNRVRKT